MATHLILAVLFIIFLLRPPAALAKDVRITTDCGTEVDDQWAIAHLALSNRIRVVGVVGSFAPNQPGGSLATAKCSSQVLRIVSRRRIPVIRGSDVRMNESVNELETPGIKFLLRISNHYSRSNRLQIIGLGPVTDLAKALLLDPSLAARVELNALAFDRYPEGGDGWNVLNDVRAWQIILDSDVPVTVTSGLIAQRDLTLKVSDLDHQFTASSKSRNFLIGLFTNWLRVHGADFPETHDSTEWPVWDEAVTAVALKLTSNSLMDRPSLKNDLSFAFPNLKSSAPFYWVKSVDRSALFGDLNRVLR